MGKFNTHGGYFAPQDYTRINEGGSHAENPNGGVQFGVDSQGVPNMLEENEPVYQDFVYSDNIEASPEILKRFKIPLKYSGKLFSEIADAFVNEAADRPNDPISNNGLNVMLARLAEAQETQKQEAEQANIEQQLSQLSPEELALLEQQMAQQEAAAQGQQGQQVPPEVAAQMAQQQGQVPPEQMQAMAEEQAMAEQQAMAQQQQAMAQQQMMQQPPTMANGGPINKFDVGGIRYVAPAINAATTLFSAIQPADKYVVNKYNPTTVQGNMQLTNPTYNPIDPNMLASRTASNFAATQRGIQNSGLGLSTGATLLSNAYTKRNAVGEALLEGQKYNDTLKTNTIAAMNANAQAAANYRNNIDQFNANVLNNAMQYNLAREYTNQKANYDAETAKYSAISQGLSNIAKDLYGIGTEDIRSEIAKNANEFTASGSPGTKAYGGYLTRKPKAFTYGGNINLYYPGGDVDTEDTEDTDIENEEVYYEDKPRRGYQGYDTVVQHPAFRIASFVPIVGGVMDWATAASDFRRGNYGMAAANIGIGALNFFPFLGTAAKIGKTGITGAKLASTAAKVNKTAKAVAAAETGAKVAKEVKAANTAAKATATATRAATKQIRNQAAEQVTANMSEEALERLAIQTNKNLPAHYIKNGYILPITTAVKGAGRQAWNGITNYALPYVGNNLGNFFTRTVPFAWGLGSGGYKLFWGDDTYAQPIDLSLYNGNANGERVTQDEEPVAAEAPVVRDSVMLYPPVNDTVMVQPVIDTTNMVQRDSVPVVVDTTQMASGYANGGPILIYRK